MSTPPAAKPDQITLQIITGKLAAISDEMGIVLARTAMSPVIYEVLDFACGLCCKDGQLIAQSNGITLFTGTFRPQVEEIIKKFGSDLRPGDVYHHERPFSGWHAHGRCHTHKTHLL